MVLTASAHDNKADREQAISTTFEELKKGMIFFEKNKSNTLFIKISKSKALRLDDVTGKQKQAFEAFTCIDIFLGELTAVQKMSVSDILAEAWACKQRQRIKSLKQTWESK